MTITGHITAIDRKHTGRVYASDTITGALYTIDSPQTGQVYGFVIGDTVRVDGSAVFNPKQFTAPTDFSLTLTDTTFWGWSYIDGTAVSSTYETVAYDPLWVNYGVWRYDKTDSTNTSDRVLQGYRYRTPMNPQVGSYYANMEMPTRNGKYDLQWLYKKDSNSYVKAVDQSFFVQRQY